jgi:DNA mismatch repair protein MutS2
LDDKSLEMLEFQRVREIVAGFTSFSASRDLVMELRPLSDRDRISLLLKQSTEARRLLSLDPEFSIGGVLDVRGHVKMAAQGRILESQTLVEIQQTLCILRRLRVGIGGLSGKLPLLWCMAEGIVELRQIETNIGNCVSPAGEVLESASPKLATIRHRLTTARKELIEHLESIIRSPRGRRIIGEPIVTEREGRYVIPVKIECRKEIRGIVHDLSNTGATAFVEPWATVEQGNVLRQLVTEEQHEVERILRELSVEVGAHEAEICHDIALAADIDVALAKARYADYAKASEPLLNGCVDDAGTTADAGPGILKLIEARHPLLIGKAVPLSVEIGRDFSGLVITGPNTGGKTVALKTIGLLTLMAQAGLPIPASEKSGIPVFDGVFADIGDEQSIEQTLSSFSWHMSNILRITTSVTQRSLVLLDELGASTDPVEGSALGRSILLYFLSRGAFVVATTHYSDLKVFAHSTSGLQNASLEFDPATLVPTYHLTVGLPGGSNALATASRLGLPPEIIDRAKEMLPEGTRHMENVLADLMSERHRMEALRADLQEKNDQAERLNRDLSYELQRLTLDERRVIEETRDRVVQEAAQLYRDIRRCASELRSKKSKEQMEQAKKTLASVQQRLHGDVWQATTAPMDQQDVDSTSLRAGDTVRLREANVEAKVLSLSERTMQIEVQVGQTRLWLGFDGVEKVTQSSPTEPPPLVSLKRGDGTKRVESQLDLRGKRAEEVEWIVDSYLNSAWLAGLSEIRVIHGFGTGTVRSIVREFLSTHSLVSSFRAGGKNEGGDGVTAVQLQQR